MSLEVSPPNWYLSASLGAPHAGRTCPPAPGCQGRWVPSRGCRVTDGHPLVQLGWVRTPRQSCVHLHTHAHMCEHMLMLVHTHAHVRTWKCPHMLLHTHRPVHTHTHTRTLPMPVPRVTLTSGTSTPTPGRAGSSPRTLGSCSGCQGLTLCPTFPRHLPHREEDRDGQIALQQPITTGLLAPAEQFHTAPPSRHRGAQR